MCERNQKNNLSVQRQEETYRSIRESVVQAQQKVYTAVNAAMVNAYWEIGQQIYLACGENERAAYGKQLLAYLSEKLTAEFGKGFDVTNLRKMRQFYLTFPIRDTLCLELSWSHYRLLMRVADEKARTFYLEESAKAGWSSRQLERQIHTMYYQRILASQDKASVAAEIEKMVPKPEYEKIIKDPYVLEFLNLPANEHFYETDLEQALIDHLQKFLLELGRGPSWRGKSTSTLKMVTDAIAYLDTQIKEKTYLGPEGLFVTEEEYPKFVRQEIIVNAVTHRAYSIGGTDIQIKMFDDRIVVENPGKLPGLVKAENIRYTHFSRNPKIAEFLKAYSFVKEYGEGVDRMCRELESVGLRVPEYHCNAFMLQTVIYNANAKKLAIGYQNPAIHLENPAIRAEKPDFKVKKLTIERFSQNISKQKYAERTIEKLLTLYNEIDTNQIFGAPEIERILDCSVTTSKDIMKKLRDMGVVVEVKGKGKGKYRFANEDELDTFINS